MSREIVSQLKFKKHKGKFDPNSFAKMIEDAYMATKREDKFTQKTSFAPSLLGYGHGNCPRYWYLAFSGVIFEEQIDSMALANMMNGTQAHERLQKLIRSLDTFKEEEREMVNANPPVRGFADTILEIDGSEVIGEIKTAKEEVFLHRQSSMSPSANHLLQLLTYMKINNSKEGFFLYENKNTQEIIVIPVEMNAKNKKIIEDLFDWMSEVWDAFQNKSLPTRVFTKSTYTCKGCPVKSSCYDMEKGDITIEKYEAPKL